MSKSLKVVCFIVIFLMVFAPFVLSADNTASLESGRVLEAKSPGSPAEAPKKFVREGDLRGMRGVLYSQIPDTTTANGYASQLDTVYPFAADMCDDITPDGTGWRIDSVTTWWANWNGFVTWDSVKAMRFMVYRDSTIISPHPVDSPFINILVSDSNFTSASFESSRVRVDMALPGSVELPADTIFWIEVQPVNVYSVNGQTGWMSADGCGNRIAFYHRFPVIGINQWTSAEIQHGDTLEVALALRGGYLSGITEENIESLILSVDQLTDPGRALISYSIGRSSSVTVKIYDILGKSVKTLVDIENETPGVRTVTWDYKNDKGTAVVNGVYLIRLESGGKTATQKMILAK
jgi:hypothetical protein